MDTSLAAFAPAPDGFLLLLGVLALDALLPLRFRPRRLRSGLLGVVARAPAELERRLNRPDRSAGKRLFRGAFAAAALLAAALLAGWAVDAMAAALPFGWILLALAIAAAISQRRPGEEAVRVSRGLAVGLAAGRDAGQRMLGHSAAAMDEEGLARATAGHLGARYADGLVAAVFWYALLGLPGMFAFRAVNVAGRALTADSTRVADFGLAASRLDRALVFLPALIATLLIAAASAFASGDGPREALKSARRSKSAATGLNWPAAAMTGALGINAAPATRAHIGRAVYLYSIAALLAYGGIVLLALARFAA